MTQTQNEMKVIIDDIKFFLWNFLDQDDNKRKNLLVHAFAPDPLIHDWYTILIYETKDYDPDVSSKPLLELTINSKGVDEKIGCQHNAHSTYIGREVYNILFRKKDKGIIREYYINTTRRGKVVIENMDEDKAGQPVFVVHEVSTGILNYPIKKGKTADLYVGTFIDLDYMGEEDWYYSFVYDKDENLISTLLLNSKSTTTDKDSYTREKGGRLTKLDTEIIKILKDDEVQGIIRPF
jgi:hypothetical protein